VLDLGRARSMANPNDELTGKIAESCITGTIDFISPEQAMNLLLDSRSDIYSLGATFFAFLTGTPPYQGGTAQKLTQHQLAPPPSVRKVRPDVPQELDAVIARMMAKKPSERYQSAAAVIEALAPWVTSTSSEGKPSAAPAGAGTKKSKRKLKARAEKATRRRRLYVGGGILAALIVAGAIAALLPSKPPSTTSAANNPTSPKTAAPAPNPVPSGEPKSITPPGRAYALDILCPAVNDSFLGGLAL
jgi:eukaryotic-like serine/threonine-protein kinase